MVGHTGVFDAAVKAVEAVDTCLGKVVDAIMAPHNAAHNNFFIINLLLILRCMLLFSSAFPYIYYY